MSQVNGNNAEHYARAIYELALADWQRDLQIVVEQLKRSPGLVEELDHAADSSQPSEQSFQERQAALDQALSSNLPEKTRNFLYLLLQNGHLHLLETVTLNLSRLVTKGPGLEVATVTTAILLSEAEKDEFQAKLTAQYGDQVELNFLVEEDILGGAIVQVGDKIIDGSIASKLNAVRENLVRS